MNTGVYTSKKKDGTTTYRVSITYRRKHISLGTYYDFDVATQVYKDGRLVIDTPSITMEDYNESFTIPHVKFVCLLNFRDNGLYISTPIYLRKQYFEYYLSSDCILKFDRDDLFFYASHKIQQRGGYLFVCDYGSQYKILGRYGIRPFAVYGRDYIMANGDKNDYRYSNIKIINQFNGVAVSSEKGNKLYKVSIHINGNYQVGTYATEEEAATAYNKAVDTLHANGFKKAYIKNYLSVLSKSDYKKLYDSVKISKKLYDLIPH